jgi:CRP/FNR family transcriptional regulator, cyclic AMP receptor protein
MVAHPIASAFPLLTPAQLERVSGISENVAIDKGTVLLREGQRSEALYLITDGVADLIKHLLEQELVVTELKPGDLLGEMSLAGDFPATATVKAATNVVALRIDKSRLMTLVESDPALGLAVFRCIASTLARRLLQITERFAFLRA